QRVGIGGTDRQRLPADAEAGERQRLDRAAGRRHAIGVDRRVAGDGDGIVVEGVSVVGGGVIAVEAEVQLAADEVDVAAAEHVVGDIAVGGEGGRGGVGLEG